MTDTDLHRPDHGPLRAAAEATELTQAVSGLVSIDGCRLADSGPLVAVSWTMHNLLRLDWDRYGTYTGTQAMNTASRGVLRAAGYAVAPFRSGDARLVTGRRGTEAGR